MRVGIIPLKERKLKRMRRTVQNRQ